MRTSKLINFNCPICEKLVFIISYAQCGCCSMYFSIYTQDNIIGVRTKLDDDIYADFETIGEWRLLIKHFNEWQYIPTTTSNIKKLLLLK